jgi:aldose 1-epimerase
MDAEPPLLLRAGSASAEVHPSAGGRLGQVDLGDGPLLRGWADGLGWAEWGCYPLLPWSNRIPGGHLRFGAIDAHLPVNWPDGSAIHGLGAAVPWTVMSATERAVDLEVRLAADPYVIRGAQLVELEPDRLHLRLRATNEGDHPVPVGIGVHPWFRRGSVRIAADERWPGEPLPTGDPVPVGGPYDLRAGTVPAPMDACFTALTAPVADVPGARLHWTGPVTQVVVYSGDPEWLCVEPVTMANNGFELAGRGTPGHGVQVLEPGGVIEVGYTFRAAGQEGESWGD